MLKNFWSEISIGLVVFLFGTLILFIIGNPQNKQQDKSIFKALLTNFEHGLTKFETIDGIQFKVVPLQFQIENLGTVPLTVVSRVPINISSNKNEPPIPLLLDPEHDPQKVMTIPPGKPEVLPAVAYIPISLLMGGMTTRITYFNVYIQVYLRARGVNYEASELVYVLTSENIELPVKQKTVFFRMTM